MAVRGIGVERNVGQHPNFWHRVLDRLDRPANKVVGIERLARVVGPKVWRRVRKQGDARNAKVASFARFLSQPVDRPAADSRQGRDWFLLALAFADEQRPDEIAGMEPIFGQHGRPRWQSRGPS